MLGLLSYQLNQLNQQALRISGSAFSLNNTNFIKIIEYAFSCGIVEDENEFSTAWIYPVGADNDARSGQHPRSHSLLGPIFLL